MFQQLHEEALLGTVAAHAEILSTFVVCVPYSFRGLDISSLSLSTLAPWVPLPSQGSAELLGYFSFDGNTQNPSSYIM